MCKRLGVIWDLKKYTNTFCSDFKDTAKSTVKSFQGIVTMEAEFLALWTTYAVLGHMHTSHGFSNSIWLEKRTIGQSRQHYNWTGVRDSEPHESAEQWLRCGQIVYEGSWYSQSKVAVSKCEAATVKQMWGALMMQKQRVAAFYRFQSSLAQPPLASRPLCRRNQT